MSNSQATRETIEIRLRPEDKATLSRAAALNSTDISGYVIGSLLPMARADIIAAERIELSGRDALRILELLENPPAAPARLVRAAKAGFALSRQRWNGRKRRSPRRMTGPRLIAATLISTCI